jgi:DnaJ-class molecular chaperone
MADSETPEEVPPGTSGSGENTCRKCEGTGKVEGRDCPDCGGTGVLNTPIGGA